jgi:hypothetical protein
MTHRLAVVPTHIGIEVAKKGACIFHCQEAVNVDLEKEVVASHPLHLLRQVPEVAVRFLPGVVVFFDVGDARVEVQSRQHEEGWVCGRQRGRHAWPSEVISTQEVVREVRYDPNERVYMHAPGQLHNIDQVAEVCCVPIANLCRNAGEQARAAGRGQGWRWGQQWVIEL